MWHVLDLQHGSGMGDGEATPRGPGTGSQKEDCEGSDSTGRATCPNARRWFPSPWKQDSTILVFHSIPWHIDSTSCRIDHIVLTLVWHPTRQFLKKDQQCNFQACLPLPFWMERRARVKACGFYNSFRSWKVVEHQFKLQWWGPRCVWLWQVKRREIWQMAYFLCLVLAEWSLNFQSGHWVLHRLWMGNF